MEYTSRQLRAFLLVSQHRSFSRAAEALFITPSGLSVLVRELERQLGFRLFDRTTRHVALTSSGSEFLVVAQQSLAAVDAATSRIGQSASQALQTFSVGAPPLISANIIIPAITEFQAHRPSLRIRLFDDRMPVILKMVQSGQLDVGLGTFAPTPGIRRTLFLRRPLVVIRADRSTALRRSSMTWSALDGEKMIFLPLHSPLQELVNKQLAHAGVTPSQIIAVNLLETQVAMVEADEGIAIIPYFGPKAFRNRKVVMSRLINPVIEAEYYQISNRGKKLPPGAEDFTEFLKSYFTR
jgi:LysR family carnitine catabolism transcriptional activator